MVRWPRRGGHGEARRGGRSERASAALQARAARAEARGRFGRGHTGASGAGGEGGGTAAAAGATAPDSPMASFSSPRARNTKSRSVVWIGEEGGAYIPPAFSPGPWLKLGLKGGQLDKSDPKTKL
jgi:hypothetical protein